MPAMKVIRPEKPAYPMLHGQRCGEIEYGQEFIETILKPTRPDGEGCPHAILGKTYARMDLPRLLPELMNAVTYDCPYSQNKYFWLYPLVVISDETPKEVAIRYNVDPLYGYSIGVCGQSDMSNPLEFCDGRIERVAMGHAYTSGWGPNDGSADTEFALIPLNNGDKVLVKVWVWYNK